MLFCYPSIDDKAGCIERTAGEQKAGERCSEHLSSLLQDDDDVTVSRAGQRVPPYTVNELP